MQARGGFFMVLYVSSASVIITPDIGGYMAGYGPDRRSEAINDDLSVTAVALVQDSTNAILLSADVCLMEADTCDRIRMLVGEETGIDAENVIINCSHTHSGPTTYGDKIEYGYINDTLIPGCIKAGKAAMAALQPAVVGVMAVDSFTGINRRQLLRDDTVVLGRNHWGTLDPTMTIIAFKTKEGVPCANIVHYGAHLTSAGVHTTITRDWAGVMVDRLNAYSGTTTMFLSGAGGDVAPRLANEHSRRGDIGHVREVGAVAAMDAFRAYTNIRTFYDEKLSVAHGKIRIPCEPVTPACECEAVIEKWKERGIDNNVARLALEMHRNGEKGEDEFIFRQTIIRIGPVVLVPFPFETCAGISRRMREYSAFGHTLTLGCTNGSNSYLPTRDQMTLGGYEVDSFKWARPRRLPEDTDTRLINQNLGLIDQLLNV